MTKHNPGVDLESLDFEVVDKEMEAEEAAEAVAATAEGNTPKAGTKPLNLWLETMPLLHDIIA